MKDMWIMFINYEPGGGIMWDVWDHKPTSEEFDASLSAAVDHHCGVDVSKQVRLECAPYPEEVLGTVFEAFGKAYAGGAGPKK